MSNATVPGAMDVGSEGGVAFGVERLSGNKRGREGGVQSSSAAAVAMAVGPSLKRSKGVLPPSITSKKLQVLLLQNKTPMDGCLLRLQQLVSAHLERPNGEGSFSDAPAGALISREELYRTADMMGYLYDGMVALVLGTLRSRYAETFGVEDGRDGSDAMPWYPDFTTPPGEGGSDPALMPKYGLDPQDSMSMFGTTHGVVAWFKLSGLDKKLRSYSCFSAWSFDVMRMMTRPDVFFEGLLPAFADGSKRGPREWDALGCLCELGREMEHALSQGKLLRGRVGKVLGCETDEIVRGAVVARHEFREFADHVWEQRETARRRAMQMMRLTLGRSNTEHVRDVLMCLGFKDVVAAADAEARANAEIAEAEARARIKAAKANVPAPTGAVADADADADCEEAVGGAPVPVQWDPTSLSSSRSPPVLMWEFKTTDTSKSLPMTAPTQNLSDTLSLTATATAPTQPRPSAAADGWIKTQPKVKSPQSAKSAASAASVASRFADSDSEDEDEDGTRTGQMFARVLGVRETDDGVIHLEDDDSE